MAEIFSVYGATWLCASLLCLPIVILSVWFSRRAVHWHVWECCNLVLPYGVWMLLMVANAENKSLANLIEGYLIQMCICPVPLMRLLLRGIVSQSVAAIMCVLALVGTAVALWGGMPPLPE